MRGWAAILRSWATSWVYSSANSGYYTRTGEFVVLDAVALPVEATETTVNAGLEADNFIISSPRLIKNTVNLGRSWVTSATSVGTIRIPATDAGFLVSTSTPSPTTR